MNSYEFAIKMELDGKKYYTEQAELNKANSLKTVFLMLAKDEEEHARILRSEFDELSYELQDNNTLAEAQNVFEGIADFKNEIREVPDQLDLYRDAMEKENQSIKLYKKMILDATDAKTKKLFEYLIRQEEEHYLILENLVILINRPKDWIEASEFGIRKEY